MPKVFQDVRQERAYQLHCSNRFSEHPFANASSFLLDSGSDLSSESGSESEESSSDEEDSDSDLPDPNEEEKLKTIKKSDILYSQLYNLNVPHPFAARRLIIGGTEISDGLQYLFEA